MDWCSYHSEVPQFFVLEQQRATPFPLGRYPCCSQRAYRFEALPNKEGCKFRVRFHLIRKKIINFQNIKKTRIKKKSHVCKIGENKKNSFTVNKILLNRIGKKKLYFSKSIEFVETRTILNIQMIENCY